MTEQQYSISKSVDLRGVSCPFNAIKAKQAIASLGDDELIEVVVDAGESLIRLVQSINDAGYRILKSKQLENAVAVAIVVGKGKTAGRH